MIKKIIEGILLIALIALAIIGVYYIFNGAVPKWGSEISAHGFFKSLGVFFKEIWTGFKTTCGF